MDDFLPEISMVVYVKHTHGKVVAIVWIDDEKRWWSINSIGEPEWFNDVFNYDDENHVTDWMPLPPKPKLPRVMKRKKERKIADPVYLFRDGDYLFVKVRKDAIGFVVDNAMQYLVFKVPAYENWVNDDILNDPGELMRWLDKYENSDQYRTSGIRLPDGKFKIFGKADEVKGDWSEIVSTHNLTPETTLILKAETNV